MKVTCRHCSRYLFDAVGTTLIEGFICTNTKCKARLNIMIITPSTSDEDAAYEFIQQEAPPKF